MVTAEELNLAFQKAGNLLGYDAKAEFAEFRDLKCKWMRTYRWAEFQVSDYLRHAPMEVIEGLARTMFSKITDEDIGYTKETSEWLTSDEFLETARPVFVSRNLWIGAVDGEFKDLNESLGRLEDSGLINGDHSRIRLFWSRTSMMDSAASTSMLMKTITLNRVLDSPDVPDAVIDYIVYKQMMYADSDFEMDNRERVSRMEELAKGHPDHAMATEWLEAHGLTV